MKKSAFVFVMAMVLTVSLGSETVILEEVLSPDTIFVSSDRIYITEDATTHIYSKEDVKYMGKFGKKGEGPGEINTSRRGGLSFTLNIVNKQIFIHNRSKIMFFEKDGKFIREKKLTGGFTRGLIPVGENYVARSFKIGEDRSFSQSLTLFDKDFNKIKEIAGRSDLDFSRGSFVKIYSEANLFTMKASGNIIYLNNSKEFIIERYSENGDKLSPLKMNYKLKKVSDARKREIRNYFRNDSRFSGFWERIKDMFEVEDQYPAIRNFFITGNRIYIHTYNRLDSGDEFYILTLKGKLIHKKILPVSAKNVLEDQPYFIENGKFYHMTENEDEEEWELHISQI